MGFFKDNKKEIALVAGSGLVAGGAVGAGLYLAGAATLPSITTASFAVSAAVVTATGFGLIALAVVATIVGLGIFLRRRFQKVGFSTSKSNSNVGKASTVTHKGLDVFDAAYSYGEAAVNCASASGGSQATRHSGPGMFEKDDGVDDGKLLMSAQPVQSHDFPESIIKGWIDQYQSQLKIYGDSGQSNISFSFDGYNIIMSPGSSQGGCVCISADPLRDELPLIKPFVVNDQGRTISEQSGDPQHDQFDNVSLGGN